MLAERLRPELARATGESLSVVQPGDGVEQPLGPRAIRIELGAHVGPELEENLIGVVRRRDAFPRAGAQRGEPLGPAGGLTHGEQDRCAARNPRVRAERATQIGPRHVGELRIDDDEVRLGTARAFEHVLSRTLLEHGITAALQQTLQPPCGFLTVAAQ